MDAALIINELDRLQSRLMNVRQDVRFWYEPHAKQKEYHAAGKAAKERLFLAGNRVGKTLAGAAEVAFHLTGLYPDWWQGVRFAKPIQAWAASVTREATRDILQTMYVGSDTVAGVIPAQTINKMIGKANMSGALDRVHVRHVSGGMSILGFKSFDQKRKSFQGTVRHVIHLDEEPPIDVLEECLLRTMTVGGHVLLTMTPLLGLTDVVRKFTEAQNTNVAVVMAGWDDVRHLDEEAKNNMRSGLRPYEVEAREKGVPVLSAGKVFAVDEADIVCKRFEIPDHYYRCFGLDFGWHNPTAAVWLAHDREHDVVYVTDVYCKREATPEQHAAEIKLRGNWPGVCDPSGQAVGAHDGLSLVGLYAAAGVRLERADNSVEAGLMQMLERMRSVRLKVFSDLEPWWREFRMYGRDANGRIIKRHDHVMDATRYAVMSGLAIARSKVPPAAMPKRGGWMGA
jgi:phage terminase large subunit-like protein